MKLKFCGAAQTVTGSQTMVTHRNHSFLVDCGLYQGEKSLRELNWEAPTYLHDIEAIVLTHAHIDHSGLLPRWAKLGWKGPVYCTQATADLLQVLLVDAAKLQEEDAKFANRTKYSNHKPAMPLYEEADAFKALEFLYPLKFNEWQEIFPGISIQLIRAGHILGSSFVQIEYEEKERNQILTFSGDIGGGHSKIIKPPVSSFETDQMVVESTYGDRCVEGALREEKLSDVINKVVGRGGTLVIPAFALGRTQDLLYSLWQLKNTKRIEDVPIYLDSPMANAVTKVYLTHKDELLLEMNGVGIVEALSSPFFTPVTSTDDSMMLCMSNEPKIVISASGMLQGGRVLRHLLHRLPDENNGVLFVGYQGVGTKGRLLQDGLRKIRIYHQEIDVEAEVFTVEGYSAHGDQNDILSWMKSIRCPISNVFINHGEEKSSEALAQVIQNSFGCSVIVPKLGDEFKL